MEAADEVPDAAGSVSTGGAAARKLPFDEPPITGRTLQIAEPAAGWIDARVADSDHADAGAYVTALVEADREAAAKLAALHAARD